jgi:predicted membrane chloride channel (bestrophin family)
MYYMQYLSIAVSLVLAYSLLGMEALSLEIEAPFGR